MNAKAALITLGALLAGGAAAATVAPFLASKVVDTNDTKLVDPSAKNVTAPPYRFQHRSVVVERSGALRVDQDEVLGTC